MTVQRFERKGQPKRIPAPIRTAGMSMISLLLAWIGVWLVLEPSSQVRGNIIFDAAMFEDIRYQGRERGMLRAQHFMTPGEEIQISFRSEEKLNDQPVANTMMRAVLQRPQDEKLAAMDGMIEHLYVQNSGNPNGTLAIDHRTFRYAANGTSKFMISANDGGPVNSYLVSTLFYVGHYEPGSILPSRRLDTGEQWTRHVSMTSDAIPGAFIEYDSTLTFEGIVNYQGTRMAQVTERMRGSIGGMMFSIPGSPNEGMYLANRYFRGRAIYLFDPMTGELLGGFHRHVGQSETLHVNDAATFEYDEARDSAALIIGEESQTFTSFTAVRLRAGR